MTDWNEARSFARNLIEAAGGSDAVQRPMTLVEICAHVEKTRIEQALLVISKELGGDSYDTLHQLVFTRLPSFDWALYVNPKAGSPGLRNKESSIVVPTMNICMYGTPYRTDYPQKMGVKPAAEIVSGILTVEGIQISKEKAARLYRRYADTIERLAAALPRYRPE